MKCCMGGLFISFWGEGAVKKKTYFLLNLLCMLFCENTSHLLVEHAASLTSLVVD